MHLSEEQSKFVEIAQKGKNILVDACIRSVYKELHADRETGC